MISDRIKLRPLSEQDLEALLTGQNNINNVNIASLAISEPLKKAINIKLVMMKSAANEDKLWLTYWLIIKNDNSEAIGTIGFKGIDKEEKSAEIGYGISGEFEGKGYATEALSLMVAWAWNTKKIEKVTAIDVLASNIGSQKVLEKNGFYRTKVNIDTIDYEINLKNSR
ncbi:MAG: GNAT family N-acetyltransferase [bacterium]|nr:GNAT family N-acetyltransferase [bacterium]